MINPPFGLLTDHRGAGRFVLPLRAAARACTLTSATMTGVLSVGTFFLAVRVCEAYGEFRRLTMRGLRRSSVRLARRIALASSTRWKFRSLSLGRSGGKGPGVGLLSAQQLDVAGE